MRLMGSRAELKGFLAVLALLGAIAVLASTGYLSREPMPLRVAVQDHLPEGSVSPMKDRPSPSQKLVGRMVRVMESAKCPICGSKNIVPTVQTTTKSKIGQLGEANGFVVFFTTFTYDGSGPVAHCLQCQSNLNGDYFDYFERQDLDKIGVYDGDRSDKR